MFSFKNTNPEKLCEQIWREHEAYIRKFCEYKLQSQKDLVDDCVSEVFLSLLKALKNNTEINYPKAWLTKVANNKITDIYRNKEKQVEREVALNEETLSGSYYDTYNFQEVTDEQIEQIKETILNELDETDRRLIENYYIKKMKVKEMASLYNLSESSVKVKLFRARKTIIYLSKKELEKFS
jgi:RNA polymerase sigma-70 factor (ECF subfamily)